MYNKYIFIIIILQKNYSSRDTIPLGRFRVSGFTHGMLLQNSRVPMPSHWSERSLIRTTSDSLQYRNSTASTHNCGKSRSRASGMWYVKNFPLPESEISAKQKQIADVRKIRKIKKSLFAAGKSNKSC
jgi:hypothetical protein